MSSPSSALHDTHDLNHYSLLVEAFALLSNQRTSYLPFIDKTKNGTENVIKDDIIINQTKDDIKDDIKTDIKDDIKERIKQDVPIPDPATSRTQRSSSLHVDDGFTPQWQPTSLAINEEKLNQDDDINSSGSSSSSGNSSDNDDNKPQTQTQTQTQTQLQTKVEHQQLEEYRFFELIREELENICGDKWKIYIQRFQNADVTDDDLIDLDDNEINNLLPAIDIRNKFKIFIKKLKGDNGDDIGMKSQSKPMDINTQSNGTLFLSDDDDDDDEMSGFGVIASVKRIKSQHFDKISTPIAPKRYKSVEEVIGNMRYIYDIDENNNRKFVSRKDLTKINGVAHSLL